MLGGKIKSVVAFIVFCLQKYELYRKYIADEKVHVCQSHHTLHLCCKLLTKTVLDYVIRVTPCGGLTLAGCEVPMKPFSHSPPLAGEEGKIR